MCFWTQLIWQGILCLFIFGCHSIKTLSVMRIARLFSGETGSEI